MALTDNLLAFYKLDNLLDSSPNGYHLTNNGGVTFSSGKIGNAGDFNGETGQGYLSRNSIPNENCTDSTIALWFRDTGSDYEDFLIAGGQGESEFAIIQVGNDIKGFFTNSGDGFFAGGSNASDGNWHFAAIRLTPTSFKIWLDGNSNSQEGTFNSISPSPYFAIGANWDGGFILWNGQIDNVGIWGRGLSDGEITELYNSGNGLEYPFGGGSPSSPAFKIAEGTNVKFQGKVKIF